MNFNKLTTYKWEIFHYIQEFHIPKGHTVSLIDTKGIPLMIFIAKNPDSSYIVRVYKNYNNNPFIPHYDDNYLEFTEAEEYFSFLFKNFEYAHEFVDCLYYHHPEFYPRPNSLDE